MSTEQQIRVPGRHSVMVNEGEFEIGASGHLVRRREDGDDLSLAQRVHRLEEQQSNKEGTT
jgi:hypothetical protein